MQVLLYYILNQVLLHDIKALRQVKDWDFAWLFALTCSNQDYSYELHMVVTWKNSVIQ